ncbi:multiple cyclophane-containing RiPP AmcA [Micromonospora sp. NBRC 107095]|nr:multiple cyclophane-containing RiPP AmcA [Micromonospora sp. NBRC 107095]GLZ57772.1 hypothetical protein Misp05_13480 [Micromonospora sp. NBRC 107095]
MTVYVSRFAFTGELAPRTAAVRSDAVDLPLLTHVWRLVFEQQARKRDR